MKKMILVGGTAYSGSTFFHMMVANDPKGYACGEVCMLISPWKSNRHQITCSCAQIPCPQWSKVQSSNQFWVNSVAAQNPEVEFFVNSCKDPIWIANQCKLLKANGYAAKNILIWKSPAEFAQSMKRRGSFEVWNRSWINYYRLYASLIPDWRAVRYKDLVSDQTAVLKSVCDYLEIPYFDEKVEYWNNEYHVLGGNTSARFHLYENKKAESIVKNYDKERLGFYRKIYYREPDDPEVLADVAREKSEKPIMEKIESVLRVMDVTNQHVDKSVIDTIKMPPLSVAMRQVRNFSREQLGKLRFS